MKKTPLLFRVFCFTLLFCAAFVICINEWVYLSARRYVYRDVEELPRKTAVLVLGSQTYGKKLSPVLRDRVRAGIAAAAAGKGEKLLLSGDHGGKYYDEVNAMRLYVLDNSVIAAENIFTDHAGFNTYDSMRRAHDVFGVKDLIIVTQEFHIYRAVYIARSLGLDAAGFALGQDHFEKSLISRWKSREFFAVVKAFFFTLVQPEPRYSGKPIPITGDGRESWD